MSAVYNTSRNGSDGVYQSVYRAAQDTYQEGDTLSATGIVLGAASLTLTRADIVLTATGDVYGFGTLTASQSGDTVSSTGFVYALSARLGSLIATQGKQSISSTGTVLVKGNGITFLQDDNVLVCNGLLEKICTFTATQADNSLRSRVSQPGPWVDAGEAVSTWADVAGAATSWNDV